MAPRLGTIGQLPIAFGGMGENARVQGCGRARALSNAVRASARNESVICPPTMILARVSSALTLCGAIRTAVRAYRNASSRSSSLCWTKAAVR